MRFRKTKVNLNLPKLRTLALHCFNYSFLSVDCPQLSVFCCPTELVDRNRIVVKYPETIRKLETGVISERLSAYKNVECLLTCDSKALSNLTLQFLPKLKELRYNKALDLSYFSKKNLAVLLTQL